MRNILCYGDSNTWGFVPGSLDGKTFIIPRYPRTVRWTGLLQKKLGPDFYLIEEGLNGRTTNLDSMQSSYKNGKTFLPVCLSTHTPLDLIIILLGINDLTAEHQRTAVQVAAGISELVQIIQASTAGANFQTAPQILLVGYPIPKHEEGFGGLYKNAIAEAQGFDAAFQAVAKQYSCHYVNAAPHVQPSAIDGVHLDAKAHQDLAEILAEKIKLIKF